MQTSWCAWSVRLARSLRDMGVWVLRGEQCRVWILEVHGSRGRSVDLLKNFVIEKSGNEFYTSGNRNSDCAADADVIGIATLGQGHSLSYPGGRVYLTRSTRTLAGRRNFNRAEIAFEHFKRIGHGGALP